MTAPKLPFADCANCPGRNRTLVPPETSTKPRLIVVGEGPGQNEVAQGKPFCGASGRVMERALGRHCGLRREDVHWTNAIPCDVAEEDMSAARKCCAKRLRHEVDSIDAPILTVGAWALQSAADMSRKPSVLSFRGSVIEPGDPVRGSAPARRMILPTIHPAFVMRAPLWEPIFTTDIARVGRILNDGYHRPEAASGRRTLIPKTVEELEAFLSDLGPEVAVDVETNGLDVYSVDLVCFVVSDTQTSVVVPWSRTQHGEGRFFNGQHDEALAIVNAALSCRTSITHNGPNYDFTVLERHGIHVGKWDDTLLAYHVLTSNFPKRLSHVASCYADVPPWKEWKHDVDLQTLWAYCGRDGLYTRIAWDGVRSQLDENDWAVYESDKHSATLCRRMGVNGFAFDSARAQQISAVLKAREAELMAEAAQVVGVDEINLLSPLQMRDAFFKRLGARILYRSKSGAPSLDVETLRAYAASSNEKISRFAEITLEYRRVRKCRATYVDGVEVRADGRVRPLWHSYGTETGRWACRTPNLANLPRPENDPAHKAGLGGIRSLYVAPPGRKLVSFDVGQMEFRVAAHVSGDANMIRACSSGDIHTANALMLFGEAFEKSEGAHRKTLRTLAKTSGFAVCYLAEPPTVHARLISAGVPVSLQQVEAMLGNLRRNFKSYYEFCAANLELTMKRGYVESPILHRKRWLGHNPEPPKVANFPIQSGAADVFNLKLWEIETRRQAAGIDALLVGAVYDAGYFDTAERDVARMEQLIAEVWAAPVRLGDFDVVLPIDPHTGERWNEL